MLVTGRTYQLSQQDTDRWTGNSDSERLLHRFHTLSGWRADRAEALRAYKMLLVHQSGYVRIGEVVRCVFSLSDLVPPRRERDGVQYLRKLILLTDGF